MAVIVTTLLVVMTTMIAVNAGGYDLIVRYNPETYLFPRAKLLDESVTSLGGLTKLTVCFRVNIDSDKSSKTMTVLSYMSRETDNDDELRIALNVDKEYVTFTLAQNPIVFRDVWINTEDWTHMCVTWDSEYGGAAILWIDNVDVGYEMGVVEEGYELGGNGSLILGNDQDDFDSSYEGKNSFYGWISDVQIWDDVISDENYSASDERGTHFRHGADIGSAKVVPTPFITLHWKTACPDAAGCSMLLYAKKSE